MGECVTGGPFGHGCSHRWVGSPDCGARSRMRLAFVAGPVAFSGGPGRSDAAVRAPMTTTTDGDAHPQVFKQEEQAAFSLGEAFLNRLMSRGQAPGTMTWMAQPMIWRSLFECPPGDRQLRCQRLWLSLLPQVGHILFRFDSPAPIGLVAHRSHFGCILLPVVVKKSEHFVVVDIPQDAWKHYTYFTMADPSQYRTAPMTCIRRSKASLLTGKAKSFFPRVVLRLPRGNPETLLEAAARSGFEGLTIEYMWKLITLLKIERGSPKPTRELEICKLLLTHVFPAENEAFYRECLAHRRRRAVGEHVFNTKLEECRGCAPPSCLGVMVPGDFWRPGPSAGGVPVRRGPSAGGPPRLPGAWPRRQEIGPSGASSMTRRFDGDAHAQRRVSSRPSRPSSARTAMRRSLRKQRRRASRLRRQNRKPSRPSGQEAWLQAGMTTALCTTSTSASRAGTALWPTLVLTSRRSPAASLPSTTTMPGR